MDHRVEPVPTVRRRATIEDVAATAGVSVATVSRALRGLPHVAPSTRARVVQVAQQLSYRPDPAAAQLATGRSRAIALAVPVLNSWYTSQVMAGAEAVCSTEGYDLIALATTGETARRALLADDAPIHRRVAGIVFVDLGLDDGEAARLAASGTAVVTLGSTTGRFPAVVIDDHRVGQLATEHLIGLGHRRIGLIGPQLDDPLGFAVPDRRRAGYRTALVAHGLTPDPTLEAAGNFSVLGGRDAMLTLLDHRDPPTAIFAMSDEMAFGAMLAAQQRSMSVPDDLSIVGVDDHDVAVVMQLTTVAQPVADHGAWAARLLIEQLDRDSDRQTTDRTHETELARVVESPVSLVERSTTAPPHRP